MAPGTERVLGAYRVVKTLYKNQHQESYQRETIPDKFGFFVFFFSKLVRQKVNRVSKIHVCM